ncbi:DNA replication licensing factor MCM3 like [Apostasia shenzhenica]|uniref:DNA helicase n=1 Tax=Apostasia shenzhenica TaxID=1088818 RepID=A0A2I0B729_9ASPA|nr:DNA replication licensing factor MCM3 like [Apostasia shenzhenica]
MRRCPSSSPEKATGIVQAFARFLLSQHSPALRCIIHSDDIALHYPLIVDFAELLDFDPALAQLLFSHPADVLPLFDQAARLSQGIVIDGTEGYEGSCGPKEFVHVRVDVAGSPLESPETFPSIGRLRVKHRGILVTVKGTVIRSGAVKMIEGERGSKFCEGTSFQFVADTIVCHDYQEIKIQESTHVLGVGCIPRSIPIILLDDLVDVVKAGDDVIVTGVLSAKWSSDLRDVRCDLDPMIISNHVRRTNELKSEIEIPDDIIRKFEQFWSDFKDTPLKGRNAILRGICPQVFGLFTVKLAVALTIIGGVQYVDASGTKVRGESHLLLVGDPGTGKSQFLKFAAKLCNRSVITTGLGSTSAGLTVTAVKDGGEWMLEAGALVLADGGLCCIDEFDRFDIVLVLLDTKNPEWDLVVSSHILSEKGESEREKDDTEDLARTTVRMLESLIRLAQAHARLMFRNEVTLLDAIAAILCIESSMTTSAIVDTVGNALHSNFTDNPDQECILLSESLVIFLEDYRISIN